MSDFRVSVIAGLLSMALSNSSAQANTYLYRCNFVQVCSDASGCILSALKLNVPATAILYSSVNGSESEQFLIGAEDLAGLSLLTVGASGTAKLSHHEDINRTNARAISYHGICR